MLVLVAACASLAEPGLPGGGTDTPDVPPASVSGRVLSKELGVMAGVHIEVSSADKSAVSGADGQWRIDGLVANLVTIRLSGLPQGCTDPGDREADLRPGAETRVRFLVDCSGGTGAESAK
jgi:hypothetical protein